VNNHEYNNELKRIDLREILIHVIHICVHVEQSRHLFFLGWLVCCGGTNSYSCPLENLKVTTKNVFIHMVPKLANVHCQRPLVLTEIISTSAAWALHTLIESSKECTINKFLSLVHPFSCVSPTFLPTTIHPPTALINHSRGKIYIHSIKMYHKYHMSIDIPALHKSIGREVLNPPKSAQQSMDL
jgi:hypothetical protein